MAITLNNNRAFTALTNAYRLMGETADNLAGIDSIFERFSIEGGVYEDQLVFTYGDVLKSYAFDPEDIDNGSMNILAPGNRATVSQETMKIDKIRQISLYIPANFLTKQACMNAGFFDGFMSLVESQVQNTLNLWKQRTANVFLGTTETSVGEQAQTVTLITPAQGATASEIEATNRLNALTIAEKLANIEVDMKDTTRDFNDKRYMVSTPAGACTIYINSKFYNAIRKVDLPTVFNTDGVMPKFESVPARYFGKIATASDVGSGKAITAGGKPASANSVRAAEEFEIGTNHYFPGDAISTDDVVYADGAFVAPVYIEDASVIAKIVHNDALKVAMALETNTEFFNPKNHSRNKWCTIMYGTGRKSIRPLITLRKA